MCAHPASCLPPLLHRRRRSSVSASASRSRLRCRPKALKITKFDTVHYMHTGMCSNTRVFQME